MKKELTGFKDMDGEKIYNSDRVSILPLFPNTPEITGRVIRLPDSTWAVNAEDQKYLLPLQQIRPLRKIK